MSQTKSSTEKRTDTERIAVALLGWKLSATDKHYRLLTHPDCNGKVTFQSDDPQPFINIGRGGIRWPDFTTLDGCRQFENALAESGLFHRYRLALIFLDTNPEETRVSALNSGGTFAEYRLVMATPAQRVVACLEVLDEVWPTNHA